MIAIMLQNFPTLLDGIKSKALSFAAGEHVFHLNDPVRHVHVVQSGSIFLIRHQGDGAALVLQRAKAGSILAEASLFSDRYHCAAEAQTAATTWAVSRLEFRKRLAGNSKFALAWSEYLAHEVRCARLHAEILSLKTVAARVNAWVACNGPLPEKGEWAGVAVQIGVSPEALYRELARRRRI
jgi:CRP/FNR family transcriptional regulator, dissimilatory nitrate respiration regulator